MDENIKLSAPFSTDEFKHALFHMHPDKSPGPDGLNPTFYQKFWALVGEDIFKQYTSWLKELQFPPKLNKTTLTLIPKCTHPTSMKDPRAIALCNVVYKIMAKVLVNRLKRILPLLISNAQFAFVHGRSICDNILAAFEVIHYMKRKTKGKKGSVALKLDISKAYDRIG